MPDEIPDGGHCSQHGAFGSEDLGSIRCPRCEPEDAPCEREALPDDGPDEWFCINDHTGCAWNDGHNGCSHPGNDLQPLGEENPAS